ncbi:GLI pathogenesis-related 2 [Aplochiton taeniatus]
MPDSNLEKEFVDAHNKYRRTHGAPPLTLSRDLCSSAQKWADHLLSLRSLKHSSTNHGENLYYSYSSAPKKLNGIDAVDSWYSEIKAYRFDRPGFSSGTGHFTQVVWKDSQQLGLGLATDGQTVFVVGQYHPAGNMCNAGYFQNNVLPPGSSPAGSGSSKTPQDGYPGKAGSGSSKTPQDGYPGKAGSGSSKTPQDGYPGKAGSGSSKTPQDGYPGKAGSGSSKTPQDGYPGKAGSGSSKTPQDGYPGRAGSGSSKTPQDGYPGKAGSGSSKTPQDGYPGKAGSGSSKTPQDGYPGKAGSGSSQTPQDGYPGKAGSGSSKTPQDGYPGKAGSGSSKTPQDGYPDQDQDTAVFQRAFLRECNERRRSHSAPPLSLSSSLSLEAQAWAQTLLRDRVLKNSSSGHGENIWAKTGPVGTTTTGEEVVEAWYKQKQNYNFSRPGNQADTGQFTQLVWCGSEQVGVGRASSSGMVIVVAFFDPAGNITNLGYHEKNVLPLGSKVNGRAVEDVSAKFQGLAVRVVTSPSVMTLKAKDSNQFSHALLKSVNQYRSQHGAGPLSLSPALCKEAQDWSTHLVSIHTLMNSNNGHGESIFYRSGSSKAPPTGSEVAESWYKEIEKYNFSSPGYQKGAGNFTQMVWKSSKEVGFGLATNGDGMFIAVAFYDPPGNFTNPGYFQDNVKGKGSRY